MYGRRVGTAATALVPCVAAVVAASDDVELLIAWRRWALSPTAKGIEALQRAWRFHSEECGGLRVVVRMASVEVVPEELVAPAMGKCQTKAGAADVSGTQRRQERRSKTIRPPGRLIMPSARWCSSVAWSTQYLVLAPDKLTICCRYERLCCPQSSAILKNTESTTGPSQVPRLHFRAPQA